MGDDELESSRNGIDLAQKAPTGTSDAVAAALGSMQLGKAKEVDEELEDLAAETSAPSRRLKEQTKELDVIKRVLNLFEPLSKAGRFRVLAYITHRFDELDRESAIKSRPASHTVSGYDCEGMDEFTPKERSFSRN